jgi:hypothetical protein
MEKYRSGAYVVMTVVNVNKPDEELNVRLNVIGASHSNGSLAAMEGDPTYDYPPVFDIHGLVKFVNSHGKPLDPGHEALYITGVVDTGEQSGGFNIAD